MNLTAALQLQGVRDTPAVLEACLEAHGGSAWWLTSAGPNEGPNVLRSNTIDENGRAVEDLATWMHGC